MKNTLDLLRYSLLCSIGVAIEYFDFIIFALLATYIGQNFFPGDASGLQLIETFMVFYAGYIIRPFSGVVLGMMSDKFGRKKAFLISICLMSISTIAIGLTPNYASIGIFGPIILVLCRLLQGVAHGAEMPIAITYISELNFKRKGLQCSILYSAASFGAICSLLLCYGLEHNLNDQEILDWGWRVPFIIGGACTFFGVLFRYYAIESPVFDNIQEPTKTIFMHEIAQNYRQILVGFFVTLFVSSLVMMCLFLPSFLSKYLSMSHETAFELTLIGMVYYAAILPIFGWFYDSLSRAKCFMITSIMIIISSIFVFPLLSSTDYYKILLFIIVLKTLLASLGSCYPMMLAELFNDKFRNTGIAISYNLAFSIGAFLPTAYLIYLEKYGGDMSVLPFTFMGLGFLAIFALIYEQKYIQRIN